ncbi:MAG: VTT domain-containing protein [Chloroflexi bacterium]|nr:VTT domain-containing protein [Chloroflexota bacterium]
MTPERRATILRIISLLAVVAISVWIFSIRDKASELAVFGYPGIFIISILANATVLLPAPGVAVVFTMGGLFNPFILGIVAGTGSAIGELSGYMAGYSGQAVIEKSDIYNRIHPFIDKYGAATVFVLAAIPNPFFDLGGVAAGVLKMPLRTFLTWCVLGKIVKMWMFAYAGAYSIDWLARFIK